MNIRDRLKKIRAERGLSQQKVAEAIGMKVSHYQRYEYEDRAPRLEQLVALARYFNVSLDYLVGESDDPERR